MDLIIINGYKPPAPSKFDVDFSNINGAIEQLENGYSYIEEVRSQVPTISLDWINIIEVDAIAILKAIEPSLFTCQYFFGTNKEDIFKCTNSKLTLKLINNGVRYYNLSLTLEG